MTARYVVAWAVMGAALVALAAAWAGPRLRRRYAELVEQQRHLAEIKQMLEREADRAARERRRHEHLQTLLAAQNEACRRAGLFRDTEPRS